MGWIKIDDGFFRHPKAIMAGRDGRILFIASVCYAGGGLTDGFIPGGALVLLGAETGVTKPKAAADALCDAGLWDRCPGGYQIVGFEQFEGGQAVSENQVERRTPAYRVWRNEVISRDGYACQDCGQREGELHAHHMLAWATHPDQRFEVDNGRTLCKGCHRLSHAAVEAD